MIGPLLCIVLVAGLLGCDRTPEREARGGTEAAGRFQLHPYLGYTYAPDREGINRHGFEASGREYPYYRAVDEFVVGVFGGTAALRVAEHEKQIAETVLPAVRGKGYSRVTVLPFAVEGWRQPQTFHAFVKYLPYIDMAIVIDGLSEVLEFADVDVRGWPADYPSADIYGPLSGVRTGNAIGTPAGRAAAYFEAWEDRIRLMDLIGLERRKPVLHFIQPNPFDGAAAQADAGRMAAVASAAYAGLGEMADRLSADGVSSNVLGDLLPAGAAPAYGEECCDLSDAGSAAVATAVAEEVELSDQIEEVLPARERVRPEPAGRSGGISLPLLGSSQ